MPPPPQTGIHPSNPRPGVFFLYFLSLYAHSFTITAQFQCSPHTHKCLLPVIPTHIRTLATMSKYIKKTIIDRFQTSITYILFLFFFHTYVHLLTHLPALNPCLLILAVVSLYLERPASASTKSSHISLVHSRISCYLYLALQIPLLDYLLLVSSLNILLLFYLTTNLGL